MSFTNLIDKNISLLSIIFIFLTASTTLSPAKDSIFKVKLKNLEQRQILISNSKTYTFNSIDGFAILDNQEETIAVVYPAEIQIDKFWSQPLSKEVFNNIKPMMKVIKITISKEKHDELKKKGKEEAKKIKISLLENKIQQKQKEKKTYEASLYSLQGEEIGTERDLKYERGKAYDEKDSIEERIDELEEEYAKLKDELNDLRDQRHQLAWATPRPNREISKLDAKIKKIIKDRKNIREDISDLRKSKRSTKGDIFKTKNDLRGTQLDIKEIKYRLQKIEKELRSLTQKLERLHNQ